MPFPQVKYMPDVPMAEGPDHEDFVADMLAATDDHRMERLVMEVMNPDEPLTPEFRGMLWDERIIDRSHSALARLGQRMAQVRVPPRGMTAAAYRELKVRISRERKAMGGVVKQMRDAAAQQKNSINAQALRITGKIHHPTLASVRAQLREGKTEAQILMSLRDRNAIPRKDAPPAELAEVFTG